MSNDYIGENNMMIKPVIQTPWADKTSVTLSKQNQPCGFFETQFYRCMEAYGVSLGRRYCDLEHRDFGECLRHDKEIKRNKAIRQERMKQFVKGELDRPFIADHPKADGHFPDYFSHNYVP
uniref:NADH dehydrogenase [ubiquinone] iron-sulfur protein 5 n=1 Tax=Plectus sambesii TaxID=2011161 RepID=A0A914XAY0_9BILA